VLVLVGNEVGNVLDCGIRVAQRKRVSLLVAKVRYMNGCEPVERDEVIQSIISILIQKETHWVISCVAY